MSNIDEQIGIINTLLRKINETSNKELIRIYTIEIKKQLQHIAEYAYNGNGFLDKLRSLDTSDDKKYYKILELTTSYLRKGSTL